MVSIQVEHKDIEIYLFLLYNFCMKEFIKKNREIIVYLIIGGLTTLVSLGSYYLLTIKLLNPNNSIELAIANTFSWIFAVTFAYFTNRIFVFQSKNKNVLKEAIKFYLSRISTLLLEIFCMFLLVNLLTINDKISKIIVQILIIIGNYIISKFFVFKK